MLDSLAGDVKYALRHFGRTPLATITIILTLTVGIGFSSTIFSVLSTVLTRPAPLVPNDPSLVRIRAMCTSPLRNPVPVAPVVMPRGTPKPGLSTPAMTICEVGVEVFGFKKSTPGISVRRKTDPPVPFRVS